MRGWISVHLIRDATVRPANTQHARGILHSKPSPARTPDFWLDGKERQLNLRVDTSVTSKIQGEAGQLRGQKNSIPFSKDD